MSMVKKIALGLIVILLLGVAALFNQWKKERSERIRLSENQTTLLTDMRVLKANQVEVGRLRLERDEFKKMSGDLGDELRKANIKINRQKSIIDTKVNVTIPIETEFIRDTATIEGHIDTVRCIKIINDHLKLDVCDVNNIAVGTIQVPIRLIHAAEPIPKFKWWFIRWGVKGVKLNVYTPNEYAEIEYIRYIEFE